MTSTTMASDDDAEQALLILFAALTTSSADDASNNAASIRASLQEKLGGPVGVVAFLLQRLWMIPMNDKLDGNGALTILSYLVESHPLEYMAITASSVRKVIERDFVFTGIMDENKTVSDALLLALAKLLVGPNSEDQVGIATDAHAALLALCRWDNGHEYHCSIAKRVLSTIDMVWSQLQLLVGGKQSSTSIMRIVTLMIDICLLGGEEITLALSNGIMDKLLHMALDHPNDDPLLQFAALDQLERLTASVNVNAARADFLLGHDIIRRGLLCMVGSPGDLSNDVNTEDGVWGEMDAINGVAAIRLLSEICRVGVMSSTAVNEGRNKFQLLLRNFQRALHNFIPNGEVERLAYIHAVSSLVGSCAVVTTASDVTSTILNDTTLLHEWLSLRVSQPKLKSAVLCSLSQVMEPSLWQESSSLSQASITSRPGDNIVLQLCQALSQANYDRDSTELILTSAKSPFIEERLGAYDILKALVMRSVGLRLLLLYDDGTGNSSSYLDWLLNQDLEHTVEGKKAKYQIAESMISCNRDVIGGLLPTKELRQLEEWIRRGPNFVTTATWEMATE
jgi:hypothetical protein